MEWNISLSHEESSIDRNDSFHNLLLAYLYLLHRACRSHILRCLVAIDIDCLSYSKHIDRQSQLECLLCAVDSSEIPLALLALSCQNDILSGVTVDETDVLPCGWNLLHEVESPCRSVSKVARSHGEMLDRTLEKHRCCERKDIRRDAMTAAFARLIVLVVVPVERTSSKVHAAYGIAYERKEGGIHSLSVAFALGKAKVLGCSHCLACYIIRIEHFPSTRQCASMEYNFNIMFEGISEDVTI